MNKTDHLHTIIGEQAELIRALKMAGKDLHQKNWNLYWEREEARTWARWYKSHSEKLRPIYTIT